MERIFKALYFVGLLVQIIVRVPYDRQRRRIPKTDQRISDAEYALLVVLLLGSLALPTIYSLTPWLRFADYRWSRETKARGGWVGAALLGVALWLFWRSHHDLGKNWSPTLEIGERQMLITEGIYRKIRHPMYASQFVWSAAQALLLQNWVAGLSGIASLLPLYLLRTPREERMMLDHFGDDYRAYMGRTGRVLPKFRGE
jgi:protein-S-isoprenylcysteine O-methyltransferase Ste14